MAAVSLQQILPHKAVKHPAYILAARHGPVVQCLTYCFASEGYRGLPEPGLSDTHSPGDSADHNAHRVARDST